MGRSDPIMFHFYKQNIKPKGDVALLGFSNNILFEGDTYDLQLSNWDINSDWNLKKKYDTIISLRCPYFSKNPEVFIEKCHEHLNDGGLLYVDWGLGDHWRFKDYKIGWKSKKEQEYAYSTSNFLWSAVWDDEFLDNEQYKLFCQRVEKFGYKDVKKAIFEEIPSVLMLQSIKKYFKVRYNIVTLWEDRPQLYMLVVGTKK